MSSHMRETNSIDTPEATPNIEMLLNIERKIRWLASWMIHHANHVRPSRDGLKVGGHQTSCASISTIMTALYMHVLRPEDRVAVKPHASPIFHSIQYLLGNQTLDKMKGLRAFGGSQSYPSRTKDSDDVDFSTGSVGLGVAATLFSAIVQDYVATHQLSEQPTKKGRMVALIGDAELDEGNIFEALLEGWKKDVRNLWWVIDYNRQSLDGVTNDYLFQRIQDFFKSVGWNVITLKYGKLQQEAFRRPAGGALKDWIDNCPNQLYSALTFKGGAAWRERLLEDLKCVRGLDKLLDGYDDAQLQELMTNLGGHDMESIIEAFDSIDSDLPHCFVAYTVKGYGLPLAGHKDNHSGIMNPEQMDVFRNDNNIAPGEEWQPFAGLDLPPKQIAAFLTHVPFNQRCAQASKHQVIPVADIVTPSAGKASTQVAFGKIMNDLAGSDSEFARRIVTTSPDVASSTNLSGWVNKRGVYHSHNKEDLFRTEKVPSALKWTQSPTGQHIELGIAESNLFIMLGSMGLSEDHFDAKLLPVGTLYDPFICRGLDSMNYACYQNARFLVVGTPAGISLAPEGGAHQSINTPLIGMAQDGLVSFEPTYADELAAIMAWSFDYMQRPEGSAVYLRLSTRPLNQPQRVLDETKRRDIINGGYWIKPPGNNSPLAIVYTGAIAPEASAALESLLEDVPDAGLLAITSPDRLYAQWQQAKARRRAGALQHRSHIEQLLAPLAANAGLVTVCDAYPTTLSWIGSVLGHRVEGLGVEQFGQSGDIEDLYRYYHIDTEAILQACAAACLNRWSKLTSP